ncbi:MAG: iron ABC transporter permease [bacterium]|nr:iron ABC transporter permease [bacterium]
MTRDDAISSVVRGFAAVIVAVLILVPLAVVGAELIAAGAAGWTPLASARVWSLLGVTVLRAAAVTVVAVAAGSVLAILLAATDLPGRRPVLLLHAFPMFLPPFLLALGWYHLLGRQGLAGSETTARLLFGEPGVALVTTAAFTPIATALVALGISGIEPSLSEAARVVARPWRVATRILIPAVWPSLALAALLIFTLSISELGVPMFLRVDAYPAAVFTRLGGVAYAPGEAFALVIPLMIVALLLLLGERLLLGRRSFAVLGLRRQNEPVFRLGPWRPAAVVLAWPAALLALLPIAALALRAARGGGFSEAGRWLGSSLRFSLTAAVLAASGVVTIGLVVGHALARRRTVSGRPARSRTAIAGDALAVLGFVTPSAVLGIGLIATWNRPSTHLVYGSLAIVVLAFMARYAVIGVRTMAVVIAQNPPHLEAAAAVFGAGFLRRLGRIVIPGNARGIALAWILALVFCLRDLETAVLLYPAGREPLTVRIFTLEANGPEAVVAALAVIHVAVTAAVLIAGGALLLRGVRR